jgi:hypothetical protein
LPAPVGGGLFPEQTRLFVTVLSSVAGRHSSSPPAARLVEERLPVILVSQILLSPTAPSPLESGAQN